MIPSTTRGVFVTSGTLSQVVWMGASVLAFFENCEGVSLLLPGGEHRRIEWVERLSMAATWPSNPSAKALEERLFSYRTMSRWAEGRAAVRAHLVSGHFYIGDGTRSVLVPGVVLDAFVGGQAG